MNINKAATIIEIAAGNDTIITLRINFPFDLSWFGNSANVNEGIAITKNSIISIFFVENGYPNCGSLKTSIAIANINVINIRAEEYAKNTREKYDVIVSRAVAPLNILLELAIPFVKVNGLFVAMKGNAEEELSESEKTHKKLGANIKSINQFNLIKEESTRTIIIYEKKDKTNTKYPRLYTQIKKRPIN